MISKIQENTISFSLNSVDLPSIDETLPEESKVEDVLSDLEQRFLKIKEKFNDAVVIDGRITTKVLDDCLDLCAPAIIEIKNDDYPNDPLFTLEVFLL